MMFSRLETQRGKSPGRSHSVKHMINFFETGSQENLSTTELPKTDSKANITSALRTTSTPKDPVIKPALYTRTSPADISPLRLARSRTAKGRLGMAAYNLLLESYSMM